MASPGALIGFLSGFVAVIASVGSGIAWINTHVPSLAILFLGVGIVLASVWIIVIIWLALDRARPGRYRVRWFVVIVALVIVLEIATVWVVEKRADEPETNYIEGYAFVALSAIPIFVLGYRLYKETHKQCLDCAETVKGNARVCRHCGYRFMPQLTDAEVLRGRSLGDLPGAS
jgi:Uncharacterised protein family UPF0547